MNRPTERITCRACGQARREGERFTWSGQHLECGKRRMNENILGITSHSGPAFQRWRQAMAASVGGILVDDDRRQE